MQWNCAFSKAIVRFRNVFGKYAALKRLSHEILGPVYWPVWMHLGLNKNRFWLLNFEEAPSIWGSHFKFWCVSVQSFSENGDSVANPSPRTGDSVANHSWRFYDSPRNFYILSSVSRRTACQKSTKIGDPQAQLPIHLRDSKNLGESLAWNASKLKMII